MKKMYARTLSIPYQMGNAQSQVAMFQCNTSFPKPDLYYLVRTRRKWGLVWLPWRTIPFKYTNRELAETYAKIAVKMENGRLRNRKQFAKIAAVVIAAAILLSRCAVEDETTGKLIPEQFAGSRINRIVYYWHWAAHYQQRSKDIVDSMERPDFNWCSMNQVKYLQACADEYFDFADTYLADGLKENFLQMDSAQREDFLNTPMDQVWRRRLLEWHKQKLKNDNSNSKVDNQR